MWERGAEVQGREAFFNPEVGICAQARQARQEAAHPLPRSRVPCWTYYHRRRAVLIGD